MALDVNRKILDGEGLDAYTRLLKLKFDNLVGDATDNGNTLEKLENRLTGVEGNQSEDESAIGTLIQEVYGNAEGTEPSRIDNTSLIRIPV